MGHNVALQIAELGRGLSPAGRRIPSGKILVPGDVAFGCDGVSLDWVVGKCKWVKPTPGLLSEFVLLWEADDARILKFAKRWGVLYLESGQPCALMTANSGARSEPLSAWRYLSRRASAALSIFANLEQGKSGNQQDWEALSSISAEFGAKALAAVANTWHLEHYAVNGQGNWFLGSVREQKMWFSLEPALWLRISRLGFTVQTNESNQWVFEVDYGGCLLASIALQLALTICGSDSLYMCSGCGRPYVREKKRPKAGCANFCNACGDGEAVRQADKRRRARVQEAREFRTAGLSVIEIARRLNASVITVGRWIKKGKNNGKTKTRKQ